MLERANHHVLKVIIGHMKCVFACVFSLSTFLSGILLSL